jgi:MOSC domain-containing protein YiiM
MCMSQSNEGSVVSMRLNVGSRKPMKEVDSARVITGQGIEGDRHLKEDGSRSRRQILLMDRETLGDFSLDDGIIRENITVVGMDFASLEAGDRVSIGEDVVLEITGECEPCARMDEIRSGLQHELDGRRGMLAYAENGGLISVGDVISVK